MLVLCLAGVRSGDEKHLVGFLVKLLDELIDRPKLHDAGEAVVHAGWQFSSRRALCAEIAQGSRGRDLVPVHCLLVDFPRSLIKHANAPFSGAESVLLLAGDLAGLASGAELVVNQKSVLISRRSLLRDLFNFADKAFERRTKAKFADIFMRNKLIDIGAPYAEQMRFLPHLLRGTRSRAERGRHLASRRGRPSLSARICRIGSRR